LPEFGSDSFLEALDETAQYKNCAHEMVAQNSYPFCDQFLRPAIVYFFAIFFCPTETSFSLRLTLLWLTPVTGTLALLLAAKTSTLWITCLAPLAAICLITVAYALLLHKPDAVTQFPEDALLFFLRGAAVALFLSLAHQAVHGRITQATNQPAQRFQLGGDSLNLTLTLLLMTGAFGSIGLLPVDLYSLMLSIPRYFEELENSQEMLMCDSTRREESHFFGIVTANASDRKGKTGRLR
jgi:hypothetical protein